MRTKTNVTISDIAERTGVNKATASVVLNGSRSGTRISASTRERIFEAAKDMGYRPNSSARSIKTGRFGAIALMWSMHPWKSFLPHNMLRGLYDSLYEHDLHLMAAMLPDNCNEIGFIPKFLSEWVVDGVIIDYHFDVPLSLIDLINSHKLPLVWTNCDRSDDCVRPDDVEGARALTERLVQLGHRRIAYVVHFTSHYSAKARRAGYVQAMSAHGLSPHIIRKEYGVTGWVSYGADLFRSEDRPTSLVCYDPYTARPLLFAALNAGLNVPQDVSIVTFSDSCHEEPATSRYITCALLPEYELGRRAPEMLASKIEAPDDPVRSLLLPLGFAPGDTCGPPRSR